MTAAGWALVLGLIVAGILAEVVACWVWPFTRCRKCHGTGIRSSPTGKNYGRCRKCKGSPEHLRIELRVWRKINGR